MKKIRYNYGEVISDCWYEVMCHIKTIPRNFIWDQIRKEADTCAEFKTNAFSKSKI